MIERDTDEPSGYNATWVTPDDETLRKINKNLKDVDPRLRYADALQIQEDSDTLTTRLLVLGQVTEELFSNPIIPTLILPEKSIAQPFGYMALPMDPIKNSRFLIVLFKLAGLDQNYYTQTRDAFLEKANQRFPAAGLTLFPPYPQQNHQ